MADRDDFVGPPPMEIKVSKGIIKIGLRQYAGQLRLDLRQWVGNGMTGTKVGVSLPISEIERLIQHIQALATFIETRGVARS